jgi:hypothetical protein
MGIGHDCVIAVGSVLGLTAPGHYILIEIRYINKDGKTALPDFITGYLGPGIGL